MLQLAHIHKTFHPKTVAHNIDLTVANGNITALLGASGSGKSTLLKIMAGLLTPDDGEIILHGQKINHLPPERRHIAMMFQDFALLPHLNVWQNAALGLRLRGVQAALARENVLPLLHEVGLAHAIERHIDALSGGEKQRVALARALAGSPKLLLLDEPFSSLDTALRGQLQILTRDLVKQRNIPAILVTHDPAEACLMADELALLSAGKIVQQGKINEVLTHPISPEAARLLGCTNVSERAYVPQNALFLNDNRGKDCAVISCFRQPERWRITLWHPTYGELVCFADAAVEKNCRLWVDDSLVIGFERA